MLMIEGEYWNSIENIEKAVRCLQESASYFEETSMSKKAEAARKTITNIRSEVS